MSENLKMHNKCHELTKLPLWECEECRRLDFTSVGRVAQGCVDCNALMRRIIPVDSLYFFEAVAEMFRRDTGYLRPGKSAAVGDYRNSDSKAREAAWQKWNNEPLDVSKLLKASRPPPATIR